VAGPDELQALVEVARVDRKQRLGNPSGRLVDLRPPELGGLAPREPARSTVPGCFCSETTAIAPPRSPILRRPSVLPERTSNTNIMAILLLQMQHQTKPAGWQPLG
jgi:hypothetical protein